jgi:hypothetical protein
MTKNHPSPPHYRSHCTRRELLQAGGLGLLGMGLGGLPSAAAGENGFGQAKACIFLFMWGGPSQLDTFDMKPQAPDEVRGEFKPIATATPGLQICEHFGHLAKRTDRVAVIRSLSHSDPAHLSSAHATVTGHLAPVVRSDDDPPSDRDTPHLGAMFSCLRPPADQMPGSVILPWKCYHPAAPGGEAPGQHGGWLGPRYDPLLLTGDPNLPDWRPPALRLMDGLSVARMENRRELLRSLDGQRPALEQAAAAGRWSEHQRSAVDLLLSPQVAEAFDISKEPEAVRDRYGRNLHGQCVLLARRLVEHGVPIVNVNWQNDGKFFWDTHGNNFKRLKDDLIPPADQALAALLDDLEERGLLDQTIVAWVGEFGRKPQITRNNAGREHWPHCYAGLMAGGGVRGGAVYGASDKHAAYPVQDPVSPQDYAATLFHALGVNTEQMLPDRDNRPHRICEGKPLLGLWG